MFTFKKKTIVVNIQHAVCIKKINLRLQLMPNPRSDHSQPVNSSPDYPVANNE